MSNFILKHRRGTTAEWENSETVLADGEIAIEQRENGKDRIIIGDGNSTYSQLSTPDYVTEEELEPFITNVLVRDLDRIAGYINSTSNDPTKFVLKTNNPAATNSVAYLFKAKAFKYKITISGTHNRFTVAGKADNSIADGKEISTPIVKVDNTTTRTEPETLIIDNSETNYPYIIVGAAFNLTAADLAISIRENYETTPDTLDSHAAEIAANKQNTEKLSNEIKNYIQAYYTNTINTPLIKNSSDVYAVYDKLVNDFNKFVTKSKLEVTGVDIPNGRELYEYTFSTEDYNSRGSYSYNNNKNGYHRLADSSISKPIVLITAGVHGDEKSAVMATLNFFTDLCNADEKTNKELTLLRNGVIFKVIPVVTRWAYDNNTRVSASKSEINGDTGELTNYPGVNINRNFAANWIASSPTVKDANGKDIVNKDYSGTAPASEFETKLVQAWLDKNGKAEDDKDSKALLHIDFHNSGYLAEVSYLGTNREENNINLNPIKECYLKAVNMMIPKWTKINEVSSDAVFNYTGFFNKKYPTDLADLAELIGGTLSQYAESQGINSVTLETSLSVNGTGQENNANALAVGAEVLGNMLVSLYDELYQQYPLQKALKEITEEIKTNRNDLVVLGSKNLFNEKTITVGGLTTIGASYTSNEKQRCSAFIPVRPKTTYAFSGIYTANTEPWLQRVCWYDSNKDFISYELGYDDTNKVKTSFVSAEGACYLRFSYLFRSAEQVQVEKAETPTVYEAYSESINPKYLDTYLDKKLKEGTEDTQVPTEDTHKFIADFETTSIEQSLGDDTLPRLALKAIKRDSSAISYNLFDRIALSKEKSRLSQEGKLIEDASIGYCTDFIPVNPNTSYIISTGLLACWYERRAEDSFISSTNILVPEKGNRDDFGNVENGVVKAPASNLPTLYMKVSFRTEKEKAEAITVFKIENGIADDNNLLGSINANRKLSNDGKVLDNTANYYCTGFIPVTPKHSYKFPKRIKVCWYKNPSEDSYLAATNMSKTDQPDSDGNVIDSVVRNPGWEYKYMRVSFVCNANELDQMEIRENVKGKPQTDVGYLYVDEATQKLYYSSVKYDRPKYLCDWKTEIAGIAQKPCAECGAHITAEGDIIFFPHPLFSDSQNDRNKNMDPIIYPHGDYSNPSIIPLSSKVKNLFNKNEVQLNSKLTQSLSSGKTFVEETPDEALNTACSSFINIKEDTEYTISSKNLGSEYIFCWCDEFGALLSYKDEKDELQYRKETWTTSTNNLSKTLTSPVGAKLLKFSFSSREIDNQGDCKIQLEEGKVATDFTPFFAKPYGVIVNRTIDNFKKNNENYFGFGEYKTWRPVDDRKALYIWKVKSPYHEPECWSATEFRHIDITHSSSTLDKGEYTSYEYSGNSYSRIYIDSEKNNPSTKNDSDVGHFHTYQVDPYSGAIIASTGDKGWHLKIFMSKDYGETWKLETPLTNLLVNGKESIKYAANRYFDTQLRFVGLVFTEDAAYYQVDDQGAHALYKIERGPDGYLDFSTLTQLTTLTKGIAGYGIALMRDPYGLFLPDRAENSANPPDSLTLKFYSLEYNKLYDIGEYYPIDGYAGFELDGRYGIPASQLTVYQPPYEDGLILGSTSNYKTLLLDILGNDKNNIIGVIKLKIRQIK